MSSNTNNTNNNFNFNFQISNDGNFIINNDFKKDDNILYAIEEINPHEYEWVKDNQTNENLYLEPKTVVSELFVIYEINKEYMLNYYYKIKNDKSNKNYELTDIFIINKIDKSSNIYKFLKKYANFNNEKLLKSIINNNKKINI